MTQDGNGNLRIFLAADRNVLRYVPTVINSVLMASSGDKEFAVLHDLQESVDLDRLLVGMPTQVNVNFIPINGLLPGSLSRNALLTPMTYGRLLMADLVDWEKFIYLDVDTLAVGDLRELFDIDISGAAGAAVFEPNTLNAGVMLINAEVWRREGISARLLRYSIEHDLRNADQDAINDLIGSRFVRLESKWNCIVDPLWGRFPLSIPGYADSAAVLHFVKGFKPWNFGRYLIPSRLQSQWDAACVPVDFPRAWGRELRTLAWQLIMLTKHWRNLRIRVE